MEKYLFSYVVTTFNFGLFIKPHKESAHIFVESTDIESAKDKLMLYLKKENDSDALIEIEPVKTI